MSDQSALYATPAQQTTNHFPSLPFSQVLPPQATIYPHNKTSPQPNRPVYPQYPTTKGPSPRGRKSSPLVTKAQNQVYQQNIQPQTASYAQVLNAPTRGGRGRPSLNHIGARGANATVQNARLPVHNNQATATRGQIVRGRGQVLARGRGLNVRGGVGRGMQPQPSRRTVPAGDPDIQVVGAVMKTTPPPQQRMPVNARGVKSVRGGRIMNNVVRQPINSQITVPAQPRLRANTRAPLVRGSSQIAPVRGATRGIVQRGPQPRMGQPRMTLNPVAMQPRGRGVPYNVPRGRGQSIRASPIVRGNPVARGATRVQVPQVSRGGRGILAARGVVMGQRTPMLTPQMGRGTQRPRNPGQQQPYRGQMPANLSSINGLSVSRPKPAALPKGVRIPSGISMSHPLGIQRPHSASQSLDGRSSPKRRVSMELSDRQMEALKNLGLM